MNIMGAWKRGYTGKDVVVTILDDGIERNHPDLLQNYVSVYVCTCKVTVSGSVFILGVFNEIQVLVFVSKVLLSVRDVWVDMTSVNVCSCL